MSDGITFGLSKEQTEKFVAWRDDPENHGECRAVEGRTAIGGAFTFRFTPTTLGSVAVVECGVCGKSINLTDYENW